MTKFELSKRLEFLMRIGLVDRTKLQQYKLAFKNPENNVKFQHYRSKILEVFFKIFDIIENNDAIYERVRQQVIVRYRNQKPMKKKSLKESVKVVKEAAKKSRKWSGKNRVVYNDWAARMNAARDDHTGVKLRMMHYDLHKGNPTTKSGKPLDPRVRNALRALSTAHVQAFDKEDHEREVNRIRANLPKLDAEMKARKAAQAAQAKPEKKRSMVGRIMDRLGRRKVEEMMVMSHSGAAAQNSTKSKAASAANEARARQEKAKRDAQQRQSQAKAAASRQKAAQAQIRNQSKGQPTT